MQRKDKRLGEAIRRKQDERKGAPTRAQIENITKQNDQIAYEKNLSILGQLERHQKKIVGNLKFNNDEFARKRGRMKMVTFNYEWEKDEIQQEIDEKKLEQTYLDTKEALAYELEKVAMTIKQIEAQQERLRIKYPEFAELKVSVDDLMEKADKAVEEFKP